MPISASEPVVERLSQRELRNEFGRVLRALAEGHSFVLTNNGVPVGRIVPIGAPSPALGITRPARRVGRMSALGIKRRAATRSLADTLDDLRGDRL
ncbi:MAG TPA: type II toxin-antitoxin system prevent-host-death family antitoxin [Arachnia sp.]|nr:type II toxin-antitoxin system prevent-host-death family antitoxin [Arachnia sp.]